MTINGEKTNTKADSDVANVSMTSVYANLIYRWETFYIPFGLTFNKITYNAPDKFEGDIDSEGGIGFNFALGWKLNQNLLIEYGGRSSIWRFDYNIEMGGDDVLVDFGRGTLAVATLALKYNFY